MLKVNLVGLKYLTTRVVHKMADGTRSYFFSKEALIAWTLQNRRTWRARGIHMNAVSPGPVETPILGDFIKTKPRASSATEK